MKVLIVKLSSLGDVIQTMPVVHDILKAHRRARIDWVVEEAFAPLVDRVEGLRRVLPMAERRWRKARFSAETDQQRASFHKRLRADTYDAVIDFQGLIKSALVARKALLAPGGFRATYANGSEACSYEWPVRFMVNKPIAMARRIHAVERYRTLASSALDYSFAGPAVYQLGAERPSTVLGQLTGAEQTTVVFAHGTTRPQNEWPVANWIALGLRLVDQGSRIALPQSSDIELARCRLIAEGIGPASVVIWPRLTLAQVLDEMAVCTGVIGVDSGLSHMAVALELPHVQIFSQPLAWRAGPLGHAHQRSVGGEQAPDVDAVHQCWVDVSLGDSIQ